VKILNVNIGQGPQAKTFIQKNGIYFCREGKAREGQQLESAIMTTPSTIDEYLSQMRKVHKGNAVRDANKAKKMKYYCKEFARQNHIVDIVDINLSSEIRQGRKMTSSYQKSVEEMGGYPAVEAEIPELISNTDYNKLFGVFSPQENHKQGKLSLDCKLCGYISFTRMGEISLYGQILGHCDHLKNGVMYLLNEFIVNLVSAKDTPDFRGIKYIMYGSHCSGTDGLKMWKKRTLFKPYYLNIL